MILPTVIFYCVVPYDGVTFCPMDNGSTDQRINGSYILALTMVAILTLTISLSLILSLPLTLTLVLALTVTLPLPLALALPLPLALGSGSCYTMDQPQPQRHQANTVRLVKDLNAANNNYTNDAMVIEPAKETKVAKIKKVLRRMSTGEVGVQHTVNSKMSQLVAATVLV